MHACYYLKSFWQHKLLKKNQSNIVYCLTKSNKPVFSIVVVVRCIEADNCTLIILSLPMLTSHFGLENLAAVDVVTLQS